MVRDVTMRDAAAAEEEERLYGHEGLRELDEKYPNRPHNHSQTLPFHDLFLTLFNPLNDNKKKPVGPVAARRKQGPHGPNAAHLTPFEKRRKIIESFVSRWRQEVGNDIYPAFRLIVPEKDRDRAMYGLKEKTIGKLLVRVMRINKDSEDGFNLLNWKLPGLNATTAMAGDFAGRCYEVISKRPIRTSPGDMTIAEVNEMLDKLSFASKEDEQYPILREFYERMNAEELMWLIRMILRQMKIGASEKTIFDIWHPDAENLFNVSSSLRRVCWELYDPSIRLDGEDVGVALMQCFQPQLAAFQMHSFEQMVAKLGPTEDDDAFWIEEKLDGERMQLHMMEDPSIAGGFRFGFWSRKAKDYTYLYGSGFEDDKSALTRHIKDAFNEGVRNIILDGEMITWDLEQDAIVPFGTLKTAALSQQQNPFSSGQRPLYRVFDCLYLNDQPLTDFTLRDRHKALERSIKPIHRRLEVHAYNEAHSATEIEPLLRQVVAEAGEGLVIKSPRSRYRLNQRNDDWIKVKPEYMTEFGEALDCVIVGGYYGSGHRGGKLSSFLCGLRVDEHQIKKGANPQKTFSFFKVGGGMTAADYAEIRHRTDGKWQKYDPKRPPKEFIELGGGDRQYERPDVWIKPEDSVVVSVKAASVTETDQFRMNLTLRFPRFKKLRTDKGWHDSLSISGFIELKDNAEQKQENKRMEMDQGRRKKPRTTKKPLVVAGSEEVKTPYAGPDTKVFDGLRFYIATESLKPEKKSKAEIEQLVRANGGKIIQQDKGADIVVADRRNVKAATLQGQGKVNMVRPAWLFHCIKQSEADVGRPILLLPMEPQHMFFTTEDDESNIDGNVDEYGDSYTRDSTVDELRELFKSMPKPEAPSFHKELADRFEDAELGGDALPGWMFRGCVVYFDTSSKAVNGNASVRSLSALDLDCQHARQIVEFAGGRVAHAVEDADVTHVVIGDDHSRLRDLRKAVARKYPVPRIVGLEWVDESWKERTLLDEERFVPH